MRRRAGRRKPPPKEPSGTDAPAFADAGALIAGYGSSTSRRGARVSSGSRGCASGDRRDARASVYGASVHRRGRAPSQL